MSGGGGGYDIGASLSASSSTTSGVNSDSRSYFGDFLVGGAKKNPAWLVPVAIGAVVLVAVLLIVRMK